MNEDIVSYARQHRDVVYGLLRRYFSLNRELLLPSDLHREYAIFAEEYGRERLAGGFLEEFTRHLNEAALHGSWAYFATGISTEFTSRRWRPRRFQSPSI
jgi:sucrose synthase